MREEGRGAREELERVRENLDHGRSGAKYAWLDVRRM